MHARHLDELDDIIYHMRHFDLVVLTGMGYRTPQHYTGALSQRRGGPVFVSDACYETGRHTNKSAGISFVYRGTGCDRRILVHVEL